MAEKRLWNEGWEFCELALCEKAYELPKDGETDGRWQPVDLPHDWLIYDTHDLYRDSVGWYRKSFTLTEADPEEEICLRFDGVYMDSAVYVNGQLAGEWKYGYSAFEFDITSLLKEGENQVLVRAVNHSPNSRWYSGAGIYRNVWWKTRKKSHILSDGIYITPEKISENNWQVTVDTELFTIEESEDVVFVLKQLLLDQQGRILAEDAAVREKGENGTALTQVLKTIENPRLWDIGKGNLYTLRTELWRKAGETEALLETEEQSFGFRTMEFSAEQGFLLNGRKVRINGSCEHHDLGCLGAAFSRAAMRRKLVKLREMGVNAIRTAHNMPAAEVMDLTDEMGFLVLSEAFDMWEKPKTTYDYGVYFNDWYETDVASWVRRDRNRASLFMWSVGNEIQDTLVEGRGVEITLGLKNAVRRHDYRHHAPVTIGSNFMKWENPQKCAEEIDCVGYNYSEYLYDEHHKAHPDWVIYGSETASVLSSRNVYHFPGSKSILTDQDEQCSALGNSITGWGAKEVEACICDDRDAYYSMGQFIWTGWDYIGEPTPYQTKNSYFGQIDTAGFPKDAFYVFQSEWTDYRENPMVHIFPYWDFNEGQLIDIRVCSNAPEVELFVNGESKGRHRIDHISGRQQVGKWQAPYRKGNIKAVAYDEAGNVIAEETRYSFGDTAYVEAVCDKETLKADGEDMLFVEISAFDQDGHPVENAKNRMFIEVTGAGRLLGIDNGDSTDFDQYKGKSKRLFGGKLLAVIGAKCEPGEIRVRISSPGLPVKTLLLQAEETAVNPGVSAYTENQECAVYAGGRMGKRLSEGLLDIPVRKAELTLSGSSVLSKESGLDEKGRPFVMVKAKLYPENASYRDMEWHAMNDTGIDVNFIELTPLEDEVKVTALGDGAFRLRCFVKNGGAAASVQSDLEMRVEGIGTAAFDPYEELHAGLCEYRSEGVIEGVNHGVSFTEKGEGEELRGIGFDHIDFGEFGSNEITLSIFSTDSNPFTFRLYDGHPRAEGSALLADCVYHKASRWMVFQKETYGLSRRLKGTCALYVETDSVFQLESFCFTRQKKAWARLTAAECDRIYGDAYEICGERIERIGNNVNLEFKDMDFGQEGSDRLILCCRSFQELNPVQIRFNGDGGSSIQVVEAKCSPEYGQQQFTIEPLKGKGTLEFIFLPGSRFDFEWFQFEKKQ